MSGDDQLRRIPLGVEHIGWRSKCPRCMQVGTIDEIPMPEGHVVIRHDASTWHVIDRDEAAAIRWDLCLRGAPTATAGASRR